MRALRRYLARHHEKSELISAAPHGGIKRHGESGQNHRNEKPQRKIEEGISGNEIV